MVNTQMGEGGGILGGELKSQLLVGLCAWEDVHRIALLQMGQFKELFPCVVLSGNSSPDNRGCIVCLSSGSGQGRSTGFLRDTELFPLLCLQTLLQ